MIGAEEFIFIFGLLLLLGVLSSKVSSRFGVPALVLFIGLGMFFGSDGPGGIAFDNPALAQLIGVVSLVLILFSGGLETDWKLVRPNLAPALTLSTVGVLITAVLTGFFCVWVLKFSVAEGILLGAIISSTDVAAVFSILRDQRTNLKKEVASLLELESGTNDPMAVFLTISAIQILQQGWGEIDRVILNFILQMVVGLLLGYILGRTYAYFLSRIKLPSAALFPVFSMAAALFTYGLTSLLNGSGFLAVYTAALIVGNSDIQFKTTQIRFHQGVAWMAQIVMFVTLGLLVFPRQLIEVSLSGLAICFFLMFVARPVSVYLSVFWSKFRIKGLTLISWVGLRGAVPIILATYPLLAQAEKSNLIFNIVFFVVISSSLIQGTSLSWLAKKLNLTEPMPEEISSPSIKLPVHLDAEILQFTLSEESKLVGQNLLKLKLPPGSGVCLIMRGKEVLTPLQATTLEANDTVFVLANRESLPIVQEIFSEQA